MMPSLSSFHSLTSCLSRRPERSVRAYPARNREPSAGRQSGFVCPQVALWASNSCGHRASEAVALDCSIQHPAADAGFNDDQEDAINGKCAQLLVSSKMTTLTTITLQPSRAQTKCLCWAAVINLLSAAASSPLKAIQMGCPLKVVRFAADWLWRAADVKLACWLPVRPFILVGIRPAWTG